MTRLTLILTLALCVILSIAQPTKPELENAAKATTNADTQQSRYRHVHYDDHNGMSQWHSTKILQDERGFMWFATWNGLNRYDGYEFAIFKSQPGDGNNLASDRIRNILLGDDGNIYCNVNNRVWCFNLKTYKFQNVEPEVQERYLAKMRYDTSAWDAKPMTVLGYEFPDVRQVMLDMQKNTWVMCTYGIDKISSLMQVAKPLDVVPKDIVRCIYTDRKGRIWVTTRNKSSVTVLDQDANLIGYLGPDGRLHKEYVSFGHPIYTVYEQRNGTMWFGSKPDGLFRVHETSDGVFSWENYREGTADEAKQGVKINCEYIYDIKEDRRGRLWLATQGGGLNLIENPQAEKLTFKNFSNVMKGHPQNNSQLRRLKIIGDSLILATSTDGFLVIDGLKGKPEALNFRVHVREAQRAKSLSCSAVMDMVIDRKGRLFISTESGGVDMLETKDLCATRFDFRHFDTSNGMGSDAALAMAEVGDEILIQCNNQVTRLNADTDIKENFNDLFFSMESRFSDAEPILLKDGRWMLSLESGILMMPETSFHQRIYVPKLVLTSYDIPGRGINYAAENCDTIRLSTEERDVTISYAALDYTDNSQIKYITRVTEQRGWWQDDEVSPWSVPTMDHSINLYNLSPGTYILEIGSTNAEGLWVNNNRKVVIIVEPTFWETWIAYLLYLLLSIAVVAGITYTIVYIRHLVRQREENLQAYLRLIDQQSVVEKDQPADGEQPAASEANTNTVVVSHLSEEDDAFMRRLMDFIEKNIGDSDVGVEDMADATATSRSSLNRKMKQLLGVTPADFLKEARLKKACQQLERTNRGVNDIAYACGFSDPKYFSKVFKASIGMSPSDYRLQATGE